MLISIVYDSGHGRTAKQAHAVAEGVRKVHGAEPKLIAVADGPIPWEALEDSDAIVFGSPTYNGLPTARLKQFFEDSTKAAWVELKWRNKIAAGFTNSGALSGDKLNTLVSIALFAAQHGMIWVGLDLHPGRNGDPNELNRLGSWLGAMAETGVHEEEPSRGDLDTASHLGQRVAEVVLQFNKSKNACSALAHKAGQSK